MICMTCKKELNQHHNFCPWCGSTLGETSAPSFLDMELTILRTDLSGFTKMSEAMIAEDVMSVLNEIFGVFTSIIESNKGTVYGVIGDEIVSIFGLQKESGFAPHMAILTAEEMFVLIRDDTGPNGHGYGNAGLTDDDINKIVEFLQGGLVDTDGYIDGIQNHRLEARELGLQAVYSRRNLPEHEPPDIVRNLPQLFPGQ